MPNHYSGDDHSRQDDSWSGEAPQTEQMYDDWENYDQYRHQFRKPNLKKIWERIIVALGWVRKIKAVPLRRKILRVAASLLLPVAAFILGLYLSGVFPDGGDHGYITLETGKGISTRVNLPDGSSIWMRPESRLRYPEQFSGKNREVNFEGQAFFNVQADSQWPFVVETGSLNIIATGTKFIVKAPAHEDLVETWLIEGKVNISWTSKENIRLQREMRSMEAMVFSKEKQMVTSSRTLSQKEANWNYYNLAFDGAPFGEVLQELASWYNVKLVVHDGMDMDKPITMTVKEESIEEILNLLGALVDFEFQFRRDSLMLKPS